MQQKPVQKNTTEARIARLLAKQDKVLVVARRSGLKVVPAPYAIVDLGGEAIGWFELEPLARKFGCLAEHETIRKWTPELFSTPVDTQR